MKSLGGLPSTANNLIYTGPEEDVIEESSNDKTKIDSTKLSKDGEFFYNQILAGADLYTDSKVKSMINQNEKNGEITPDDANIIRNILGL